jgi:two-component system NtrC family sensor kinase
VRAPIRLLLALDVVAVGATSGALLLAGGLPLAARGALRVPALTWLAVAATVLGSALGIVLLFRSVARPVDRILASAARLGAGEAGLPILVAQSDAPGHGLARAAVAFERVAAALVAERARLATKVAELEASNAQLAAARASLLRTERLATVGRLAAGIAHEVGNPLGAVQGYAELAVGKLGEGGEGLAAARDYVARIGAEARRIDAIVRGLLDFARPAPEPPEPVRVSAAFETAARLARVEGRFREVEIDVALPAELPRVLSNERRLSQVFLNLLLNAADAMDGKGTVRVGARAEADTVLVELDDTGPGVPPELRSRVFDPFFTTKEPGRGTGLGLAVCHGILEAMQGGIEVSAAPGGGARFTLRLPAAEAR